MAVTQNSYTGNGSKTTYDFTFPYLKQSEIKAKLNGTATTAYTVPTATSIQFNTAPSSGDKILIYRETDTDSLAATFYAGSAIKSQDLNDNFTQNLYVTQEVADRYVNKLGGSVMTGNLELGEDIVIKFEGATDNAYETTLTAADPTADRTITLPNVTGTVVTTGDTGTVARSMIANDAINGTKIADDAVDSEHIVADSLDTEHYAPNSVDTIAIGNDAVTNVQIADDAIDSEQYVDGSIDRVHLAADIVDGTKIADDSIDSEHYVDGSIDHAHLSNDCIDGDNIQDDVINSEHYVAGSIDTEHIANLQVTTDKLAADAVTGAKIGDDQVDSEHIAAGALDNEHYSSGSIDSGKLSSATVVTNSEQASASVNDTSFFTTSASDARYFNISSGDTIKDGQTFPDNDTTIATTAAINDRIVDLVEEVGGFVPIANETSFPAANPDVNNGAGTLVSIKEFASSHTPSGGTVTIANGAGSGNTVTITGCGSTVLGAGYGGIVETTSTLHTYTFHRLSPKSTEVTTVASNITNINTVANNNTNINTVAGNNTNINTVAGISGNVTTVAGISSNVTSVANNSSNINSVNSNSSNINTVAGAISNVNTVGGSISNVNSVASNISGVNDFADRYRVASSDPSSNNDEGDLCFNTTSNELRVYNGSAWQGGVTATGNLAGLGANQFSGNITFTGSQTVDGRDLSVDGAKLDNIEAQATADQTASEIRTLVESASDSNVFTDADHTKLNGIETNATADQTRTDIEGLNITSVGTLTDLIVDGDVTFHGANHSVIWDKSDNRFELQDNAAITFGSGADLQIYHDGSTSFIKDSGTGNLNFQGSHFDFINAAGNEYAARFYNDGACELYHDNTKRIETTSSGATVTGGLTVSGDLQVQGTTTTVDSTTMTVADKNIEIAKGAANDVAADGAGITVDSGDGDKTWNWVNSTDAWTSSEHIHIPDSKHLILGTGSDFKVYHDGSNSWVREMGTGALYIDTDGSVISLTKGGAGENMAKFYTDGAVELYHDNTKRIETTSSGANIVGALTVNGSPLSSAPTIDGTASGAIAANKAVIVKSDGEFTAAAETISAISNPTRGSFSYKKAAEMEAIRAVWCPSIDRLVYISTTRNSNELWMQISSVSIDASGSIGESLYPAFNGGTRIMGNITAKEGCYDLAWDDDNQILFTFWHEGSGNNSYCRAWTVNSNSISGGTQFTVQNSGNAANGQFMTCKYIGDAKFILAWNVNWGHGKMCVISVNTSTKACTKGTEYNLTDGTDTEDRLQGGYFGDKNPDGDIPYQWIRIGNSGNSTHKVLYARTLRVNGTTITGSADARISTGSQIQNEMEGDDANRTQIPVVSYDSDNDVYLACYSEAADANGVGYGSATYGYVQPRFYCKAYSTNGTSSAPSVIGSNVRIYAPNQASNQTNSIGHCSHGLASHYDPIYNRHNVFWCNSKGDVRLAHVATTTGSSPTYDLLDFGQDDHATTGQYVAAQWREFSTIPFVESIGTTNGGVGSSTVNKTVLFATDPSASASYKGHIKSSWGGPYATSTSNITSGNFIGFADSAVSNGQTVTVNTVGNTTTKSGMTPGTLYNLDAAGNLTTSTGTGVAAGKAISTTKLLVKI